MAWIGQGIAFGCLCLSAAWMEVSGTDAHGIWMVIVLWVIFGKWYPK